MCKGTISENRERYVEERAVRPKYRRQKGKKGKGGGRECCKKTMSLFSTAVENILEPVWVIFIPAMPLRKTILPPSFCPV